MAPLMSIWRNFFLGSEPTTGWGPFRRLDVGEAKETAIGEMRKMGIDVRDPEQPVGTLSGGERQSVAIARAVYFGAKVLILDEPTAALGVKQSGVVLRYIVAARDRGLGVIFITHNPHHAYPVGDRFLILKRGQSLGDYAKDDITREELTQLMAGGAELEALAHEIENVVRPEELKEMTGPADGLVRSKLALSASDSSLVLPDGWPSASLVLTSTLRHGRPGQRRPVRRRGRGRRSMDPSDSSSRSAARRPTSPWPRPASGTGRPSSPRSATTPSGATSPPKLVGFGVDVRFVGVDPVLRTPLAFAALTPPEDPELLFYRQPAAPDMQLAPGDVDANVARGVSVLWVAGSAMAEDPARSTIQGWLDARGQGPPHRARPRLPSAAVGGSGRGGGGHRRGRRPRHDRHRQPGRVRGRRRHRRP